MNGDEDNSASNQAVEIMTTLIEAIQLAQLSNFCERMQRSRSYGISMPDGDAIGTSFSGCSEPAEHW